MSLSIQIMEILENNAQMQYNAKAIFYAIYGRKAQHIKPHDIKQIVAKIRTELTRLSIRKKIRRKKRGFYQAKPFPHVIQKLENPEVKIHGIKIEINIAENNKKGVLPISADNNTFEDWLVARNFDAIGCNRWKAVRFWEDRRITFTVHSGGLFEVFINASSCPLGFSDWVRLLNWFNGFFDPLLFDTDRLWVRQIGFNRDFRKLRLEGVSSVSVQVMTNLWSQVYQKEKEGLVRFEHHMVFPKSTLNVDDVTRSLLLITSPMSENGNGNGVVRPDTDRREIV